MEVRNSSQTPLLFIFLFCAFTAGTMKSMKNPESEIKHLLASHLDIDPNSIHISQLKDGIVNCFNNTNFKITVADKHYFAKWANQNGAILKTSLENEIVCRQVATTIHTPKIVACNSEKTLMITEFIENSKVIDLKQSEAKKRYIGMLQKLHTSKVCFPSKFCPLEAISSYIESAEKAGVILPQILNEKIIPIIKTFKKEDIFLYEAPCHLDPQSGNVLDDGNTLYLIDWECAAMCDPLFDLASMCATEEFSDDEMREFLRLYLNGEPSGHDFQRLHQMRTLADLRFCTYCYLQTKISPTRTELYKEFAEQFLAQLIKRLEKFYN